MGKPIRSAFKQIAYADLFEEYTKRIAKFTACSSLGNFSRSSKEPDEASVLWICERDRLQANLLSSEDLAFELKRIINSGVNHWEIIIGGPNGFSAEELRQLNPNKLWSFGRLTLPHELATVVAAEQIYRAWTIIRGQPYHLGH